MKRVPGELAEFVDPRGVERLFAYGDLLERRGVELGLIGPADRGRIWERHIIDSLKGVPAFSASDRLSYDIGSGAGLPGIPLAVAVPSCRFVLVESTARRAGFLEMAVERLDLANASVVRGRAEALNDDADVVTARAFAPIARTWAAAVPLLRNGGRLIYYAGERFDVDSARELTSPERPASVEMHWFLASGTPLAIMARG